MLHPLPLFSLPADDDSDSENDNSDSEAEKKKKKKKKADKKKKLLSPEEDDVMKSYYDLVSQETFTSEYQKKKVIAGCFFELLV
jgi:hypothetical protein